MSDPITNAVDRHLDTIEIPQRFRDSLGRWQHRGILPGGFLAAVLRGDLFDAFNRADAKSRPLIQKIASYIQRELPAGCYGSQANMDRWHCHVIGKSA